MLIKKLFILIFSVTILLSVAGISCAYSDIEISAECAVVINADTQEIIYQKDAHKQKSMASTTKIMTSLLAIESGHLFEKVSVKGKIHSEGSSVGLKEGNILTLQNLVYAMMLESGNDAAEVTAEYLEGSEEHFAEAMNNKALLIGMTNTNFVTASGLDSDEHYSTAYDMALLGSYAIKNPVFRKICSTKTKTVEFIKPQYSSTYQNHNKLLNYCDGVFGIKTGFTKKSGRCLVTSCTREGVTLVCVTLNAPDDWNDHQKLYDTCFSQIRTQLIDCSFSKSINIYGSTVNSVKIKSADDSYYFLSASEQEIKTKIILPEILYAPIEKGEIIGEIRIYSGNKEIKTVPIYAEDSAESVTGKLLKKMNLIEKIILKYKNRKEKSL